MVMSANIIPFNITTAAAGNTQDVTGFGFQPKALLLWQCGTTSSVDAITKENAGQGFGCAASSTSQRTLVTIQGDNFATTEENVQASAVACINNIGINGLDQGAAALQSYLADGFRLVINTQFTAANRIHALGLGGDSLTAAECFTFQMTSSTGTQDFTGLSFQPDCVIFLTYPDNAFASGDQENGSTFAIGTAVSSTQRAALAMRGRNNVSPSQTEAYCLSIEAGAGFTRNVNSGITQRWDLVQFLSNGFRINKLETAQLFILGIALQGGNYAVLNNLTQTNTTTDITLTPGFRTAAGLVVSHCTTESTQDTTQAGASLSLGAFTSPTNQGTHANRNQNNVSTTNVVTAVEHDECYVNINQSTTTIDGLMSAKSISDTAVVFRMDDADPSQNFFWALLVGPAAGGVEVTDSQPAYLRGQQAATPSAQDAYLRGQTAATPSTQDAYLRGQTAATPSAQDAYLRGQTAATPSAQPAYLTAIASAVTSQPAYLRGQLTAAPTSQTAYMGGGVFPFTDNYTGADDDPWNADKWVTEAG